MLTHHPDVYLYGALVEAEPYLQNDKRIHVIWSGRQRFQLAKELGYTHIDCIIEPVFHKMVGEAGRFKKLNQ